MRGEALSRLVLVVGSTLVGLAFLEVALRITWRSEALARQMRTNFIRPHATTGVVHVAGTVLEFPFPEHPRGKLVFRTNNLGLRKDVDTQVDKAAGIFRVLVLGDSHTDGVVYNDESYANRLERLFAERDGVRAEVLNAGVGTSHPLPHLLWFREFGRRLRPDLIVVGAYAGNDIVELAVFDNPLLCGGRAGCGLLARRPSTFDEAKRWLPRDLALYRLMADGIRTTRVADWLHAMGLMGYRYQPSPERAARICRDCLWQDLYQAYIAREHPSEMRAAFETTEAILRELDGEAIRIGARLVLLVTPTRRQVEPEEDPGRIGQIMNVLGLSKQDAAFADVVRRTFLDLGNRLGIPALDLLPVFRASYLRTRRPLYWYTDWHLNVEGHRLAAEALREFLRGQGLAPSGGAR